MKRNLICFAALLIFCFSQKLTAQVSRCSAVENPLSCNANPTIPFLKDSDIAVMYNVKYSVKNRVVDISYKNSVELLSDCGDVIPYSCTPDAGSLLVYDVYYPSNSKTVYPCYLEKPLPAIILFHGGGFSDCNSAETGGNTDTYCREFAKRGFVAFDVHYRSGRLKDPNVVNQDLNNNYFSASAFLATYRAFQDGRGAVRSIIAHQLGPFAPPYRIDPENIFVGGISSGAMIAMSLGYYSANMLYEIFGDAQYKLGALDDSAYLGPGTLKYRIKGVLNLWGGAYVPASYATSPATFFLKNRNRAGIDLNPPMIAFQGAQDVTVPVNRANVYYSSDSFFRSATICSNPMGKFTLPFNDSIEPLKDLVFIGSKGLYNVLAGDLGIPSELYIDSDMKHGLGSTSDFGTDIPVQNNRTLIIPYLVERSVSFFQAVVNNVAPSLADTKFTDCQNFRYGCNPGNNHEVCGSGVGESSYALNKNLNKNNTVASENELRIFTVSRSNKAIRLFFDETGHYQVCLYDMFGRVVRKYNLNNTLSVTLSCDQLPAGIYIIKAARGKRSQTQKINLL